MSAASCVVVLVRNRMKSFPRMCYWTVWDRAHLLKPKREEQKLFLVNASGFALLLLFQPTGPKDCLMPIVPAC